MDEQGLSGFHGFGKLVYETRRHEAVVNQVFRLDLCLGNRVAKNDIMSI